jgi:hypothetical protein
MHRFGNPLDRKKQDPSKAPYVNPFGGLQSSPDRTLLKKHEREGSESKATRKSQNKRGGW